MVIAVLVERDLVILIILARKIKHDCACLEDPELSILDSWNATIGIDWTLAKRVRWHAEYGKSSTHSPRTMALSACSSKYQ